MAYRAEDHHVAPGIHALHVRFDADADEVNALSTLTAILPSLLQLNALSLVGNVDDAEITSLAEMLPKVSSLQVFSLETADPEAIEEGPTEMASLALAASCVQLPLLTSMTLDGSLLGPCGAAVLAAGFRSLPHLVSLDLGSLWIEGQLEFGILRHRCNGNFDYSR